MANQNSELDELSADELRGQLIALQEENRTLYIHVANMVADLRTPLTVIQSYADMLLSEENDLFSPLDEKQTKAVDAMRNSAVRSNEVIEGLIKMLTKA